MIYALYTALLEHFYGRLSYIYVHISHLKKAVNIQSYRAPVQDAYESSEECYQEAEVAIIPDPYREGKEHDSDVRDVGEAVEEDHPVHQRVLLDFEPDKDHNIDDKDGEIVRYECEKIKY